MMMMNYSGGGGGGGGGGVNQPVYVHDRRILDFDWDTPY